MMDVAAEKSRVLVVDDEPQITRVLRTVLSSQGYQVRTASEGEAALASVAEFRPELVITDLYMPHMDGIELCRRIRALSAVPIIVLSVKGEERTKGMGRLGAGIGLGMMLGPLKSRFHPAMLWALVQTVGFYPPGQVVELDDGALAVVLAPNAKDLARPHVRPIIVEGQRVAAGEVPDLLPIPTGRAIKRALRGAEYPGEEPAAA